MPILMSDGALLNLADKSNEELYAAEAGGVFITDSQAEAMIAESQALTHALHTEGAWKESTAREISRQLEAIEESEADVTPSDLLPGTRKQWLKYRGEVSNWGPASPGFPDSAYRPVRPS